MQGKSLVISQLSNVMRKRKDSMENMINQSSIDWPKSDRLPLIRNVYTMIEQRMLYICA